MNKSEFILIYSYKSDINAVPDLFCTKIWRQLRLGQMLEHRLLQEYKCDLIYSVRRYGYI